MGRPARGANTIIQYLADKGGKISAANKRGLTPLDLAMGKGGGAAGRQPPKEKTAALIEKLGGTAGVEVTQVAKAEYRCVLAGSVDEFAGRIPPGVRPVVLT